MVDLGPGTSRRVVMAMAVIVVVAALAFYLFRTVTTPFGTSGRAYYHFRWGSLRIAEFDFNDDGLIEIRGKWAGWASDRFADETFVGAEASSRCDGDFDVHIEYAAGRIYLDANGDGVSECHSQVDGFRWMSERCDAWRTWVPYEEPSASPPGESTQLPVCR